MGATIMLLNLPLKSIFKEIAILLFFSVMIAFISNYFSPRGIALIGEWDLRKGVISSKPKNDVVDHQREIYDLREVKDLYDSGKVIFVDARPEEVYIDGHIKGAISLPVHSFDERVAAFIDSYPETIFIVTYCSGRECNDSHMLAELLISSGYSNVSVFVDGYPEWKREGYPVE